MRSKLFQTRGRYTYEQIDYLDADIVPVKILEGCQIDFKKVFADLDDEQDAGQDAESDAD